MRLGPNRASQAPAATDHRESRFFPGPVWIVEERGETDTFHTAGRRQAAQIRQRRKDIDELSEPAARGILLFAGGINDQRGAGRFFHEAHLGPEALVLAEMPAV